MKKFKVKATQRYAKWVLPIFCYALEEVKEAYRSEGVDANFLVEHQLIKSSVQPMWHKCNVSFLEGKYIHTKYRKPKYTDEPDEKYDAVFDLEGSDEWKELCDQIQFMNYEEVFGVIEQVRDDIIEDHGDAILEAIEDCEDASTEFEKIGSELIEQFSHLAVSVEDIKCLPIVTLDVLRIFEKAELDDTPYNVFLMRCAMMGVMANLPELSEHIHGKLEDEKLTLRKQPNRNDQGRKTGQ